MHLSCPSLLEETPADVGECASSTLLDSGSSWESIFLVLFHVIMRWRYLRTCCIYLLSFIMTCFATVYGSVPPFAYTPISNSGMILIYNELCWFTLFSSEYFEATKESFFTIKEKTLVCENLFKKSQFHGLEKCFCFSQC